MATAMPRMTGVGSEVMLGILSVVGLSAVVHLLTRVWDRLGLERFARVWMAFGLPHPRALEARLASARSAGTSGAAATSGADGNAVVQNSLGTASWIVACERASNGGVAAADAMCAICLSEPYLGVTTNCGHVFCALCMLQYWEHRFRPRPVECPCCRRQVTLLMAHLTRTEEGTTDGAEATRKIEQYNLTFSSLPRSVRSRVPGVPAGASCEAPSQWFQSMLDAPTLVRRAWSDAIGRRLLFATLFGIRGIVLPTVAACLYLLSPIDIIPEAFMGFIGIIDDVLIVLGVGLYIAEVYRNAVARRGIAHAHHPHAD